MKEIFSNSSYMYFLSKVSLTIRKEEGKSESIL